jgi:hypothetical protein
MTEFTSPSPISRQIFDLTIVFFGVQIIGIFPVKDCGKAIAQVILWEGVEIRILQ